MITIQPYKMVPNGQKERTPPQESRQNLGGGVTGELGEWIQLDEIIKRYPLTADKQLLIDGIMVRRESQQFGIYFTKVRRNDLDVLKLGNELIEAKAKIDPIRTNDSQPRGIVTFREWFHEVPKTEAAAVCEIQDSRSIVKSITTGFTFHLGELHLEVKFEGGNI